MSSAADAFRMAIYEALGYAPSVIEPGRFQRFATADKRGDNAGWCQLFDDCRAGVFGDFRRGGQSLWTAQRRELMTPEERSAITRQRIQAQAQRQAQQRHDYAENARRIAALWAGSLPVTEGDPVSRYLKRRGLAGPVPRCLRLHPALPCWQGDSHTTWPAMVAPLCRHDGVMVALHRTYLTMDGCKAPVPTVKKLTRAAGPLAGTCIPLHGEQRGVIGLAEGIETALAAHLASGLPTVAAYCASNLAAFIWPTGVKRIYVFADADEAGTAAAQSLKERALRAGLRVVVVVPSTPGADWCDVWTQRPALSDTAPGAAA